MIQSANETRVLLKQINSAMYFSRVRTFDFCAKGISLSIFTKNENKTVAD